MRKSVIFIFVLLLLSLGLNARIVTYDDALNEAGFNLNRISGSGVGITFSISEFTLEDVRINGEEMQSIILPNTFLQNEAGAPNLPGNGRYLALPQGAMASLHIVSSRTEVFHNIEMAPAPRIPLDTEEGPLDYSRDLSIYNRDAFYPANPVQLGDVTMIRGVDAVMVGITPFQYNPVTKELIVYRDIELEVDFIGGNGHFGADNLRSRWWDPIFADTFLNYGSLPVMNYNHTNSRDGAEYLIICPDDAVFLAWADSIKVFRTMQGISTVIKTTAEVGGNTPTAIENYIDDIMAAGTGWDPAPAAILLLGDYGTTGSTVVSPIYNSYCASDNIYADVSGNQMPDVTLARMTAQNETHLQTMVTKFLDNERTPPTNPDFYDHPITALGWQDDRWFQICSETVGGFFNNELGKTSVRINALGYPANNHTTGPWSTNQNTNMIMNVFGPDGLGYIPNTPQELGGFTGGTATMVINSINSGAFMLQHRDHGGTTGWGEPAFQSSHINSLTNSDLVYVFSINCLTGKYNITGECFAETFHRHTYNGENAGCLGIIAASEVSYSFVNDTFVWGMYDNMWTDFLPQYGTTPEHRGILPAFANSAGKYFLQQSNWPYNTNNKEVTYNLFHHHGDAFSTVYSVIPQNLTVIHDPVLLSALDYFTIIADDGSLIGLTVNGVLIGVGEGTGAPVDIPIVQQLPGVVIDVTVTKQDYYRYSAQVDVIPPAGPYVLFDSYTMDDSAGNGNDLMDYGEFILLTISVENVGIDQADNVTVTLSTDDQYITITDPTEFYGNIAAGAVATVADGFSVEVCDSIPDEHMFLFQVSAADGTNTWLSNFVIEAYAPVLWADEMIIDDAAGNNNGVLDPGETVTITIPTYNDGHASSPEAIADLSCSNQLITIVQSPVNLGEIGSQSFEDAVYTVTASDEITFGTPVTFIYNVTAGEYIVTRNYDTSVGIFIEDFESGGFSSFPWEFVGCNISWPNVNPIEDFSIIDTIPDVNWNIATDSFYSGTASAKSYPITHNQASFMNLTVDVVADGEISFYYRVACEYSPSQTYFYDGLIFFIDDVEAGRYQPESDGSTPWTYAGYPVTSGTHTFTWVYVKDSSDGSTSLPEDCAWVDYIVFPTLSLINGTIAGQVTLLPTGNIEDVIISTCYGSTSPNAGGDYSFTSPVGIFDVTASLAGYETITVYDVEVFEDQTTTVDFVLYYLAPPIDLEGELEDCYVTLTWEQSGTDRSANMNNTDNSRDFQHYNIYRNVDSGAFTLLDTTEALTYVDSLFNSGDYGYYVTAEYSQNSESDPTDTIIIPYVQVDAGNELISIVTMLNGNYPNPFNPETTIKFTTKDTEKNTELIIYNIKGQRVKILVNKKLDVGYHSVVWNGKDSNGKPVSSGIYFYRLRTNGYDKTKRMLLLK